MINEFFIVVAAALYFGWLWNSRSAADYSKSDSLDDRRKNEAEPAKRRYDSNPQGEAQ